METVRKEYSSELAQLAPIRQWIGTICREAWQSTEDRFEEVLLHELLTATQEAATNIVKHAYEGEEGQPIEVSVDVEPKKVRVTLSHYGIGFDPKDVPPPCFDGSRTGGFGVYLIERLVDEVSYTCDESTGRRSVELVKLMHHHDFPAKG